MWHSRQAQSHPHFPSPDPATPGALIGPVSTVLDLSSRIRFRSNQHNPQVPPCPTAVINTQLLVPHHSMSAGGTQGASEGETSRFRCYLCHLLVMTWAAFISSVTPSFFNCNMK
jgi:hypothetical protein